MVLRFTYPMLLCPAPKGRALSVGGRRPSVCLSISPVPGPKSRMGVANWKLAGRKPTGDPRPHLEIKRSNTCKGHIVAAALQACLYYVLCIAINVRAACSLSLLLFLFLSHCVQLWLLYPPYLLILFYGIWIWFDLIWHSEQRTLVEWNSERKFTLHLLTPRSVGNP